MKCPLTVSLPGLSVLLVLLILLPPSARAQTRPVELRDMMSADAYRRAGLNQLSHGQLRALNDWLSDWARAEFRRTERLGSGAQSCLLDLNPLKGAWVIAHDGAKLGKVSTRYGSMDSIYGSSYGRTSLVNRESPYAHPQGSLSAFNPRCETPPSIVKDGQVVGYLTVNASFCPRVDPGVLLGWLDR